MSKSASKSASKSRSKFILNKNLMTNTRNIALGVFVLLYLYLNYRNPCKIRVVFLLISSILTFYLFDDIYAAILLSMVLSIVCSYMCKGRIIEGMENKKSDEEDFENEDFEDEDFDNKANTLNKISDDSENFSDNFIDHNETMKNNLKNLDMKSIEKMTADTQELLDTQKKLMKTMETMAPLLKQGMNMVDMFKEKK